MGMWKIAARGGDPAEPLPVVRTENTDLDRPIRALVSKRKGHRVIFAAY